MPPAKKINPLKRAKQRVQADLASYYADPYSAFEHVGLVDDNNIMHWTAVMKGINGTPYQGGRWKLDIVFPEEYPTKPPTIRFVTTICHPNIHIQTGEICLNILKDGIKDGWSGAYTMSATLISIHQLLLSEQSDDPLNLDVALLYRQGDRAAAEALIRYYTQTEKWRGTI